MYVVKWTNRASLAYYRTLIFWNKHNESTAYSKKIMLETTRAIELIQSNPKIGRVITTKEGEVRRILVLRKFAIHYRLMRGIIEITTFWNNSQNPKK